MLSILIPTYNYTVFSLVENLYNQLCKIEIEYEIIVLDDHSTSFLEENKKIANFKSCYFTQNGTNLGRTKTRQTLAESAKFEWLLFLDADVMPENADFIEKYLACFIDDQLVFGGYKYEKNQPDATKMLRYHYGKNREEKSELIRNKKPYEFAFSGNMLIRKKLFTTLNQNNLKNIYGMDVFFAHQLWENQITILHINNAIIHLGIEKNEVFFQKVLESIAFRKKILSEKTGIEKTNKLLAKYKLIKKWHLHNLIKIGFSITEPLLKKLILSKNPSLLSFDLYRLGYICKIP
jgi:glycosyltransferase involved in cell wall biosynthesis